MEYYTRAVTVRKPINRFGKIGYNLVVQGIKTNNIDKFNKGKRIKFTKTEVYIKELRRKPEKDKIYILLEGLDYEN